MANDDHDDHTSLGTATTTDPGFIPLEMFDYEIAKWMANTELKRQRKGVEEEMDRHERLQVLSQATTFGEMSDYVLGGANLHRENQSLLIDEYWSPVPVDVKYKGLSREQIRGVLVLQNAFRTWIILKRYRQILKSRASAGSVSFGDVKSVATALYIQASVRRVIAKRIVEDKIAENRLRDKAFARFCGALKEGITVTMFSRKYGTSPSRKISFDDSFNNLTFTTSFGTKGKVELRSIYKIHTGLSETMYAHSRQPLLSRCICLECRSERVVDLELSSAKQTREMYQGFERLILLLSGTLSPFFTDNFGIPRRAGPSIIENAINESKTDEDLSKRMYKSKPDEMRFWAAIRTLQNEYDSWQAEQDNERRAFVRAKELESDTLAKRLQTTAHEKMKMDAGGAQKVMKLVRFVDPDGTTKMVEVTADESGEGDQRSALQVLERKSSKVAKSPYRKSKRYEEEGKSSNWPGIPFTKKRSSKDSDSVVAAEETVIDSYDTVPVSERKDSTAAIRSDDYSVTSSLHSIETKESNNDLLVDPAYISSSGTIKVKRELFADADEVDSLPSTSELDKHLQREPQAQAEAPSSSKEVVASQSFWQSLFCMTPATGSEKAENATHTSATTEDNSRSSSDRHIDNESHYSSHYNDESELGDNEDFSCGDVEEKDGEEEDDDEEEDDEDDEDDDEDDEDDDDDDDDDSDDDEGDDEDGDMGEDVSYNEDLGMNNKSRGHLHLAAHDTCSNDDAGVDDDPYSVDGSENAVADEGSSDDFDEE
jgi:hypothetical protein